MELIIIFIFRYKKQIVAIEDDLEYLDDSDFFHKNNNLLFNIKENSSHKNYFRIQKNINKH